MVQTVLSAKVVAEPVVVVDFVAVAVVAESVVVLLTPVVALLVLLPVVEQ